MHFVFIFLLVLFSRLMDSVKNRKYRTGNAHFIIFKNRTGTVADKIIKVPVDPGRSAQKSES